MLRVGTLYFGYGANMDPCNLSQRTGTEIPDGWPARLTGWRLAFNLRDEGEALVANLVQEDGCTTYGVVYRLPHEALHALDEYENAPEQYRRATLWVEPVGRQARQAALVYLGQPAWTVEEGLPEADYLELLVRGAKLHRLPNDYVAWFRSVARGEAAGCYTESR